jgi:hypothetical protein
VTALVTSIETRLRANDVTQVATLVMAALVVTLAMAWPSTPGASNESWYGFAQARGVILALLALGFGATAAAERPRRAVASGIVALLLAVMALPLEVAAHAATYPATPLWWSFVGHTVAQSSYFVIGLALGHLATRARLRLFLPLLVPGLLVGLVMLDVRLGWTFLNPLTAPLQVSTTFAATATLVTVAGLLWAWRRWRGSTADDDEVPTP